MQLVSLILVHWRVIYPVDSAFEQLAPVCSKISVGKIAREKKQAPSLSLFRILFSFRSFPLTESHEIDTKRKGNIFPDLAKIKIIVISEIDRDRINYEWRFNKAFETFDRPNTGIQGLL